MTMWVEWNVCEKYIFIVKEKNELERFLNLEVLLGNMRLNMNCEKQKKNIIYVLCTFSYKYYSKECYCVFIHAPGAPELYHPLWNLKMRFILLP